MSDDPLSREQFDARLRALNARRETERAAEIAGAKGRSDWGMAVKLSSEFIAAVIVGGALGFAFDWLFDTSPWGLIVLFMLGFGAAILNVLRAVGRAPASRLNVAAVDRAARGAAGREDDHRPG